MSLLFAVVALLESDATPSRLGQLFAYTSECKIVIFFVRSRFPGPLRLWLTHACSEADAREGCPFRSSGLLKCTWPWTCAPREARRWSRRLCASSLPRLRTSQVNPVSLQASWLLEQRSACCQHAERKTVSTENGLERQIWERFQKWKPRRLTWWFRGSDETECSGVWGVGPGFTEICFSFSPCSADSFYRPLFPNLTALSRLCCCPPISHRITNSFPAHTSAVTLNISLTAFGSQLNQKS